MNTQDSATIRFETCSPQQAQGFFSTLPHELTPPEWVMLIGEVCKNPNPDVLKILIQQPTQYPFAPHHLSSVPYVLKKSSAQHNEVWGDFLAKHQIQHETTILKKQFYSGIESHNNMLVHILMTHLGDGVSYPTVLREAVVHKNRPLIKHMMTEHPDCIAEASDMLQHDSYHKVHHYWRTWVAKHENKQIHQALNTMKDLKPRQKTPKKI